MVLQDGGLSRGTHRRRVWTVGIPRPSLAQVDSERINKSKKDSHARIRTGVTSEGIFEVTSWCADLYTTQECIDVDMVAGACPYKGVCLEVSFP